MQEKFSLRHYRYSKEIVGVLSPIAELIKASEIKSAEKKIALLALDMLSKIDSNAVSPKKANDYFLLLFIYLEDNFPKLRLHGEAQDLILEGMVLHDLGKYYGADIKLMKSLAKRIIDGKKSKRQPVWKKINGNWERKLKNRENEKTKK